MKGCCAPSVLFSKIPSPSQHAEQKGRWTDSRGGRGAHLFTKERKRTLFSGGQEALCGAGLVFDFHGFCTALDPVVEITMTGGETPERWRILPTWL
ncbi:hypothetical protein J4Q44_G00178090 [Coregonus suidteri]|uniref:Uncharacterized protein n=1 Tax=Coregonus suidteri TaxID=861788 RepID=A0AAN8LTU5_9TELE